MLEMDILELVTTKDEWFKEDSDFFAFIEGCRVPSRDGSWPKESKTCILEGIGPMEIEEPFGIPKKIDIVELNK